MKYGFSIFNFVTLCLPTLLGAMEAQEFFEREGNIRGEPSCSLEDLPNELLENIVSFLGQNVTDLANLSLMCQGLRKISQEKLELLSCTFKERLAKDNKVLPFNLLEDKAFMGSFHLASKVSVSFSLSLPLFEDSTCFSSYHFSPVFSIFDGGRYKVTSVKQLEKFQGPQLDEASFFQINEGIKKLEEWKIPNLERFKFRFQQTVKLRRHIRMIETLEKIYDLTLTEVKELKVSNYFRQLESKKKKSRVSYKMPLGIEFRPSSNEPQINFRPF
ncbi:F-box protein [Candidatus Odyssella thessalonicensis]|uniref:F-box protein n=1 Tax=Candidatus Odyssella thessalonicensis TaxID=84647 RepID=UPI000225BE94|nr:F-box protein [Candidatus Odyssella thessalonicensis]